MPDHQRYRITEKLDAGGMAEVYRGIAESAVGGIKKAVAIKKILPSLTKNKKFVSMFLDEARVSMHLQHANIVGVFDIGMADTAYFIVMEFVDGANLKSILESLRRSGKKLPMSQVIFIMMQVCSALSYAHDATDPETGRELGVVHRDISPPNILVSKRGEVKLVDFGLAKATSQLESTDPGVVKGKFSYLSPEAASGKEVDRRADIFAVGILLYELLTGKRLFYGETDYQTVELVRQARVPAIQAQNPEVQPELEQIIRKALSRDLAARFQSAGDLQDALAQYLFAQRLKVTSRDIEQLVVGVLKEKQKQKAVEQPVGNLIDALINEEIVRFTSLDGIDNDPSAVGKSPSPTEQGNSPLDPGSFVDTRGWADDLRTGNTASRNGQPIPLTKKKKKDDPSGVVITTGLEDLLEGDGTLTPQPAPKARGASGSAPRLDPPRSMVAPKAASPGKLIALVVMVLLVLAGAGVAAILFTRH